MPIGRTWKNTLFIERLSRLVERAFETETESLRRRELSRALAEVRSCARQSWKRCRKRRERPLAERSMRARLRESTVGIILDSLKPGRRSKIRPARSGRPDWLAPGGRETDARAPFDPESVDRELELEDRRRDAARKPSPWGSRAEKRVDHLRLDAWAIARRLIRQAELELVPGRKQGVCNGSEEDLRSRYPEAYFRNHRANVVHCNKVPQRLGELDRDEALEELDMKLRRKR